MGVKINRIVRVGVLISWICFVLFILFYGLAVMKYPGGTYEDPRQNGFSFSENYLCDLLDDFTYVLADNPAKLYARISLGFLCIGIFLFWTYFPHLFEKPTKPIVWSRTSGMTAMLVTVFLRPENHDIVTIVAGLFGALALVLAIFELYRGRMRNYTISGFLLLILFLLNFYIYESRQWIDALPLLQKLTMIFGLGWFMALGLSIRKRLSL